MFDHIGGINTLLNILSIGATAIIPNRRNPYDICNIIEKYQIKVLPASPTFLNLLLMSDAYKKYNLFFNSKFRSATSSSNSLW